MAKRRCDFGQECDLGQKFDFELSVYCWDWSDFSVILGR